MIAFFACKVFANYIQIICVQVEANLTPQKKKHSNSLSGGSRAGPLVVFWKSWVRRDVQNGFRLFRLRNRVGIGLGRLVCKRKGIVYFLRNRVQE